MKLLHVLTLLMVGFAVGCNKTVEVVDGVVPAEFQEEAAKYIGGYGGEMNGRHGVISLEIVDGRAVMVFHAAEGESKDIVGEGCGAQIGQLTQVTVDGDKRVLKGMTFALDVGSCKGIQGREVYVSVKEKRDQIQLNASIYTHSTRHHVPGHCTGHRENRHCTPGEWTTHDHHIYGRFNKIDDI